jgi:hypothetical protein
VESVGLAGVAGETRRRRAHDDVDFLLLLRKLVNRERDRGGRQFGDHVDAFDVVPAPRNGAAEIRLVLVVGGDDLDLVASTSPPKSSTAILAASNDHLPP